MESPYWWKMWQVLLLMHSPPLTYFSWSYSNHHHPSPWWPFVFRNRLYFSFIRLWTLRTYIRKVTRCQSLDDIFRMTTSDVRIRYLWFQKIQFCDNKCCLHTSVRACCPRTLINVQNKKYVSYVRTYVRIMIISTTVEESLLCKKWFQQKSQFFILNTDFF